MASKLQGTDNPQDYYNTDGLQEITNKPKNFFFRIIESKNADYKVGEVVVAHFGWRTHTIVGEVTLKASPPILRRIDPSITISLSTALGILGMPG